MLLALAGMALNALGVVHLTVDQVASVFPVAGFLVALGITAVVLSGLNLRRVSDPLDDILEASHKIAEGDYSVRVDENGPREVRSMARAFNLMAAQLKAQDDQRRAWLADVTHELRTPLTILQGNLEGVVDEVYTADKVRLKSMLEEVQILSRLTEDLRVLAQAEGGNLRLRTEPADLGALIRETVEAFQPQAEAAGVRLQLAVPAEVRPLELDPERMRQVLTNLLFNAVRYTPAGKSVTIGLSERSEQGRPGEMVVVEDEGPGISAEDLPRVFDRFYKGADSRGMGLGLAIAKHILEAHGGRISVSSEPGKGTRISFWLPA